MSVPPYIPPPPNQTTRAAMKYLLTGEADAWNRLINILSKATENVFLTEPGITLRRAKLRFLELWLVERFAPYRDADAETICAAAGRDEFRYLGKPDRL
jgi:hypothetical protein